MADLSIMKALAVPGGAPLTMSSREIAELTGKEHKNVLADIRSMLEALNLNSAEFSAQYKDSTGRTLPMFALPEDLTITLVTGYSVPMRHRVVTRWKELEAVAQAQTPALPRSFAEALQLAADQARQIEAQHQALAIAEPKAAALDRIATASGSTCITNAAKSLQMSPRALFAWLSAHRWIYRRVGGKGWVAYQDRIQSGHLEHKVALVDKADGTEKAVEQVLVTPKGLALLGRSVKTA